MDVESKESAFIACQLNNVMPRGRACYSLDHRDLGTRPGTWVHTYLPNNYFGAILGMGILAP